MKKQDWRESCCFCCIDRLGSPCHRALREEGVQGAPLGDIQTPHVVERAFCLRQKSRGGGWAGPVSGQCPLTLFHPCSCLSFVFPSILGLGQPHMAVFLVLTGEHWLVSLLLSFPPHQGCAIVFLPCVQGLGNIMCLLMFNPLHFPEVLCSVAHELLIFSRLVCFVQTAAFLELGPPLCFGGSLLLHSETIWQLLSVTWKPETARRLFFSKTSQVPSPHRHLGPPQERDQCDTKCSQEDGGFSPPIKASLGLSLNPNKGENHQIHLCGCLLGSSPTPRLHLGLSLSFSLPGFLPSLPL